MKPSIALTIAGSDSGGGAGIQADLKTFAAFGVYGASVLTALTAQNTQGIRAVSDVDPSFVMDQLVAVLDDLSVAAAKTGMLGRASVVEAVVTALGRRQVPHLIVDPVMVASGGTVLLDPSAVDCLRKRLLPLATVVTPNLHEAAILAQRLVSSVADMREAARAMIRLGARAVLVTGGHLDEARVAGAWPRDAIDVLYDGHEFSEFSVPRIATANTHGTGCTLSAAVTAGLALGQDLYRAVESAKSYVTSALETALAIGHGVGPINHNCLKRS